MTYVFNRGINPKERLDYKLFELFWNTSVRFFNYSVFKRYTEIALVDVRKNIDLRIGRTIFERIEEQFFHCKIQKRKIYVYLIFFLKMGRVTETLLDIKKEFKFSGSSLTFSKMYLVETEENSKF